MKYRLFICTFLIIVCSQTIYANNYKERRDIINNILSDDSSRSNNKTIPSRKTLKKNTTNKNTNIIQTTTGADQVLLKTGINFYHNGMYNAALEKMKELKKKHSKSPFIDNANTWIGKILIKQYKYKDAITILSKIKPNSGAYPEALYTIALANEYQRNIINSISQYKQVSSQFPQHELADNALLKSGKLLLQINKGAQALEAAITIIKRYRDRENIDDAYFLLANIFEHDQHLKDLETARKVYKAFIKKAADGSSYFSRSPLLRRVKFNLKKLERTYFRFE